MQTLEPLWRCPFITKNNKQNFFMPYLEKFWLFDDTLETLTSIIRTGLPILVELMELANSVTIFLSQMALLRWLTFLRESQAVILIVLLFWTYFFLAASICSTMAFPPLGNAENVVVAVSIDFSSNSKRGIHFIA